MNCLSDIEDMVYEAQRVRDAICKPSSRALNAASFVDGLDGLIADRSERTRALSWCPGGAAAASEKSKTRQPFAKKTAPTRSATSG